MKISTKAWVAYIKKMSQISETAADLMQKWVQKNGFGNDKALLDYAFALSQHYGQAIGALSCQMYEATAAAQGAVIPTAEIADLPEYGEVAKAVHGTMKQSQLNVPATIARLIKQVGADTTLKNAGRDGAEFAWVPHGDTCAFCITLASRGWQCMSKKALKNGHAEHIHAHCDCEYAVRFDGKSSVAGYDPEKYERIYYNMPGKNSQDKINSLRRLISGKNPLTLDQVEFIIELEGNPEILGGRSPQQWKNYLEFLGFETKPLGAGSLRGIKFEDGGGYRINYRGDGYLQYHPEGRHHKVAYYKVSNARNGTKRFDTEGVELDESKR